MRFTLIDHVVELELGKKIVAVKNLSMAEEYLADHFPGFPVMPGVLMLEAMTQAGAWLVRASEDFAHSMVVLKQVGNVKYGPICRAWANPDGYGRNHQPKRTRNAIESQRNGRWTPLRGG